MEKLQDFMMLFRLTPDPNHQPTATELSRQKQQWGEWIAGIAAAGKLVGTTQLGFNGKQLSADNRVLDGIHLAGQTAVGGTLTVKAGSLDEALQLAQGCPILHIGGNVEIRDTIPHSF
ncbi:YciI family protein [Taibaiella koreensis]|uniref:YciI family protein n=1 Tax=Taibaiella koreensis TaxID=1268548 RepID=UPI001968ADE3|nr:YciI family protein [Taibaiella koreensis]